MKGTRILIVALIVLIVLPAAGYVGWLLKKSETLEVVVINKSYTTFKNSENRSLQHVLAHNKIQSIGKFMYDLSEQYYGLHWKDGEMVIKNPRLKDINRMVERTDLVYFADAFGVVEADNVGDATPVAYGGLNNTDYTLLRELITRDRTVVAECSFFGAPTDPLVRYNIETLLDIFYSGWHGIYVQELSRKLSDRIGNDIHAMYAEYRGTPWEYEGAGLVLVNHEAKRVVVLKEGVDIDTQGGIIHTAQEVADMLNVAEYTSYEGWFSLLFARSNTVLSSFNLQPTEAGRQILLESGLSESFPALIKTGNGYFMAGDFGKAKSSALLPRTSFIGGIFAKAKHKSNSAGNFFYTYYQPVMDHVLAEVSEHHQTAAEEE